MTNTPLHINMECLFAPEIPGTYSHMSCAKTLDLVELEAVHFPWCTTKRDENDRKEGLVMPLESYLRTLWAFFQAVRHGAVGNMPHEEDASLSYLRLSISGSWQVTTTSPEALAATRTDITIPLVLPLTPIILVAHVETQWARCQSEAGAVSLLTR